MQKKIYYREKSEKFFINYSKRKEKSRKNFVKHLKILNNTTGEIRNIEYDLVEDVEKIYYNLTQRSIDLLNLTDELDYSGCAFVTLTLDSQYHKYTSASGKHIKNKKWNTATIQDGYLKLNKTFKAIHKQLYRDKIEFKYLKALEPHKSFTPHLHALFYYKNKQEFNNLLKIIGNKINIVSKHKIQKKDGNIKNMLVGGNGIGRVEVEEIKDKSRGSAYLLKYLRKSYLENPYRLDGWKKYNKIRLITCSDNIVPNYIFNRLYNFLPKNFKTGDLSSLTWCRKNINIYVKTLESGCVIKDKIKLKNDNARFSVYVEKEEIEEVNEKFDEIEIELENRIEKLETECDMYNFLYRYSFENKHEECRREEYFINLTRIKSEWDKLKKIYNKPIVKKTKIIGMRIWDNLLQMEIYNKADFELMYEMIEESSSNLRTLFS